MHRDQLYVADTYNNKIKRIDVKRKSVETIAGTGARGDSDQPAAFHEPAGLAAAADKLYVADTNNHRIRVIDLDKNYQVSTLAIAGLEPPTLEPKQSAAPFAHVEALQVPLAKVRSVDGRLRLAVTVDLPRGYKVNDLAPMMYQVERSKGSDLVADAFAGRPQRLVPPARAFEIDVPLQVPTGNGTIKLSLNFFYCQEGGQGLCKMRSLGWEIPLQIREAAEADVVELTATLD
jgi:hypothetical protein